MKKIIAVLMLFLVLTVPAMAVDTDGVEEAVPDSAREILGSLTVRDILEGRGFFERVTDWLVRNIGGAVSEAAKSACVAGVVTMLCSLTAAASPDGKIPEYVLLGGALAIIGCCAGDMKSYLGQTRTALSELSDFSKALLPCIAAASSAGGSVAAGAARYTVSALFLDVLMTAGTGFILPLIGAYAVLSAADAALPAGALGGPVKLMGRVCGIFLTGLTTVFTMCLSLTGVIAGNADKAAGSIAKTAISAALPVVGSILSDAAETYLAGAELIRGAVGVFGLAAVLGVCLKPVLILGIHFLLFKAAACVTEPFSEGRLSALVGNVANAYGMALGLLGSGAAMLFVSVVLGTEALSG